MRQLHPGLPTCFCNSRYDLVRLSGISPRSREVSGTKVRKWDSCFSRNFARVHGGNFRPITHGAIPAVDVPQAGLYRRAVWPSGLCRLRTMHHLVSCWNRYYRGNGGVEGCTIDRCPSRLTIKWIKKETRDTFTTALKINSREMQKAYRFIPDSSICSTSRNR